MAPLGDGVTPEPVRRIFKDDQPMNILCTKMVYNVTNRDFLRLLAK